MRKERTLCILGVWVAILPFLGFPNLWREIFFLLSGLALIYLSYLFYIEAQARQKKNQTDSKTFIDNISSEE